MRRFLKNNGLTLFFFLLFLGSLVGQAVTGVAEYNHQQIVQGAETLSFLGYITSSDFGVDVAENWQSEYLQFFLYIFLTVWLAQCGSPESKDVDELGTESDKDQKVGRYAEPDSPRWARTGGWRTAVYGWSLGAVLGLFFALSWLAQSISGTAAYNSQALNQQEDPVSWFGYVSTPDFWNRTLQNWQSEFLAVASMAALSIYLRQRGSPESKPIGQSHTSTGVSG